MPLRTPIVFGAKPIPLVPNTCPGNGQRSPLRFSPLVSLLQLFFCHVLNLKQLWGGEDGSFVMSETSSSYRFSPRRWAKTTITVSSIKLPIFRAVPTMRPHTVPKFLGPNIYWLKHGLELWQRWNRSLFLLLIKLFLYL
jgi:hypothetical protein